MERRRRATQQPAEYPQWSPRSGRRKFLTDVGVAAGTLASFTFIQGAGCMSGRALDGLYSVYLPSGPSYRPVALTANAALDYFVEVVTPNYSLYAWLTGQDPELLPLLDGVLLRHSRQEIMEIQPRQQVELEMVRELANAYYRAANTGGGDGGDAPTRDFTRLVLTVVERQPDGGKPL